MATSTYSERYSALYVPANGRPLSRNTGPNDDSVTPTWAVTDLDGIGDFKTLIPVRSGGRILFVDLSDFADLGSGELDMDIVLRTLDKDGVVTDTILFNAGTFFATAQTAGAVYRVWCDVLVPDCASGFGHITSYVNTAAVTPIQGTGHIFAKIN